MQYFCNFIKTKLHVTLTPLCCNPSQVSLGLMVNPPKQGDASYAQFRNEKDSLLNSLKRRARLMTDAFNALEGVSCQETEGKSNSLLPE